MLFDQGDRRTFFHLVMLRRQYKLTSRPQSFLVKLLPAAFLQLYPILILLFIISSAPTATPGVDGDHVKFVAILPAPRRNDPRGLYRLLHRSGGVSRTAKSARYPLEEHCMSLLLPSSPNIPSSDIVLTLSPSVVVSPGLLLLALRRRRVDTRGARPAELAVNKDEPAADAAVRNHVQG